MLRELSTLWCTLTMVDSYWELLQDKKEQRNKSKKTRSMKEQRNKSKRTRSASTICLKSMLIPCRFKTSLIHTLQLVLSLIIFFLSSYITVRLLHTTTCFGISRNTLSLENHFLVWCSQKMDVHQRTFHTSAFTMTKMKKFMLSTDKVNSLMFQFQVDNSKWSLIWRMKSNLEIVQIWV